MFNRGKKEPPVTAVPSNVLVVESLPVLNQSDFPSLPQLTDGDYLSIIGSSWQNAEREYAAGVLITAYARAGEWKPIDAMAYGDLIDQHPLFHPFNRNFLQLVINGMWSLAEIGQLELVQLGDIQYVVPTSAMAMVALASPSVRLGVYAPTAPE